MKVLTKQNNYSEDLKDIYITDGGKTLTILFAPNLDLYWTVTDDNILTKLTNNNDILSIDFEITKENYLVYLEFEKLFNNIKNINLPYKTYSKGYYKKYNIANYNTLFKNNTITWYSDETNELVANYLQIKESNESFIVSFHTQPFIEGYCFDFHYYNSIPIRFRNSGSRYEPFNVLFMQMYNELHNVDDAYEEGHQIYIEEYLYNDQKKLIKKK